MSVTLTLARFADGGSIPSDVFGGAGVTGGEDG